MGKDIFYTQNQSGTNIITLFKELLQMSFKKDNITEKQAKSLNSYLPYKVMLKRNLHRSDPGTSPGHCFWRHRLQARFSDQPGDGMNLMFFGKFLLCLSLSKQVLILFPCLNTISEGRRGQHVAWTAKWPGYQ